MSTLHYMTDGKPATLHTFFQAGVWHWGITIPREHGSGFQVIAYSESGFPRESDALLNGNLALTRIVNRPLAVSGNIRVPAYSFTEDRRRYMRERLRCAMARLIQCDEASSETARRWATAWGALIGEQHFEKALRIRRRLKAPGSQTS